MALGPTWHKSTPEYPPRGGKHRVSESCRKYPVTLIWFVPRLGVQPQCFSGLVQKENTSYAPCYAWVSAPCCAHMHYAKRFMATFSARSQINPARQWLE